MPLSKRRSRSEMSLDFLQDFGTPDKEDKDSTDHADEQNKNVSNKQASSKSEPPQIFIENTPLKDVDDGHANLPKIHRAVSEGNLELLKELVESGDADVNTPDPDGWPPLYTAIRKGKLECASYLLKRGASDFYDRQYEEYQRRLALSRTRTQSLK